MAVTRRPSIGEAIRPRLAPAVGMCLDAMLFVLPRGLPFDVENVIGGLPERIAFVSLLLTWFLLAVDWVLCVLRMIVHERSVRGVQVAWRIWLVAIYAHVLYAIVGPMGLKEAWMRPLACLAVSVAMAMLALLPDDPRLLVTDRDEDKP